MRVFTPRRCDVDYLMARLNVPVVYRAHVQPSLGDAPLSGKELFTAQAVMTMMRLVECSQKHDNVPGSLLIAYDMPVFMDRSAEQQFIPDEMRLGIDEALADESTWNTCRGIARATYNSIVFDYVFMLPGCQDEALLGENGVAGGFVEIDDWSQAVGILGAERFW